MERSCIDCKNVLHCNKFKKVDAPICEDFLINCSNCDKCNDCSLPEPFYDCKNYVFKDIHNDGTPNHYSVNGFSPIEAFDNGLISRTELRGFIKGNIIKYVTRYEFKNGVDDLFKALDYLEMLIRFENNEDLR